MIYAITNHHNQIKIGFTSRKTSDRLAELQTGCPDKLTLVGEWTGTQTDERRIQYLLKQRLSRCNSEWFNLNVVDAIDLINRILAKCHN